MKNHLLVSLLLMHFYLDALDKSYKSVTKKNRVTSNISVPSVTEHTIKGLIGSELGLLMIGADWCTHCKDMGPIFSESSQKHKNHAKYGFLILGNSFSESNQIVRALEKKYALQIDAIPMILVFKRNKLVDQVRGAVSREQLAALIKKHASSCAIASLEKPSSTLKKGIPQKN